MPASAAKAFIKALKYFRFLEDESKTSASKSRIENFTALLEKKLALAPGETDMVAMQHIFKI